MHSGQEWSALDAKPVFVAVKRNPSCDIYYKYSDHVDILGLVHMVVYRTERVHEPSSSSLFDNNWTFCWKYDLRTKIF